MAIEVISEIIPKNGGLFGVTNSSYIVGGTHQVKTIDEMNNIPDRRRKVGMLCYVQDLDKYYILKENSWEEFKSESTSIKLDNTLTEDSKNAVTSSGIYKGIQDALDSKLVILTQSQYDSIKHNNNTIYFIIEDSTTDWHFGSTFPIILS